MRIEKPYSPRDKHAQVTLNGTIVDLAKTPIFACDDEQGWVDFAVTERTEKGAIRFLVDENREPLVRREHGAVTIAFLEGV